MREAAGALDYSWGQGGSRQGSTVTLCFQEGVIGGPRSLLYSRRELSEEGVGGCLQLLLGSGKVSVKALDNTWHQGGWRWRLVTTPGAHAGSVLPSGSTQGKSYHPDPAPPLCTPPKQWQLVFKAAQASSAFQPWSYWIPALPPPVCLHIANPSLLPGSDLWSPSSSIQPLPALVDMRVRLGSTGRQH